MRPHGWNKQSSIPLFLLSPLPKKQLGPSLHPSTPSLKANVNSLVLGCSLSSFSLSMEFWEGKVPMLEAESHRQAGIEPVKQEIHSPQKSLQVPFIVSLEPKQEQPEKSGILGSEPHLALPCYTMTLSP